jgi:hypothetical protein
MKRICAISLTVAVLLLQGCATPISQDRIASADYGDAPSDAYQQVLRDRFASILIDPTAPLYEFDKPKKGFTKQSPIFNTREQFGWRVCGTVNSKNRYGGYAGKSPFFALFRGDTIVEMIYGESNPDPVYGSLTNKQIENACNR